MQEIHARVLRAFYLRGAVQAPGAECTFSPAERALAFEMRGVGKVEFLGDVPTSGPMTLASAGGLVSGAPTDNAAHAPKPGGQGKGSGKAAPPASEQE